MLLNDFLSNDLDSIIKDCSIVKLQPISNDKGEIIKIIIEYIPDEKR